MRGPMYFGTGKEGRKNGAMANANLGGPSKTTHQKLKGGYTFQNGVMKNMQLEFLTIAAQSEKNCNPLVQTEKYQVIGLVLQNNGFAL